MATSRKMAMSALDGDNLATETLPEININPEPVLTKAVQQYVVFRLVNDKMNKFTLDGICHDVENPKTKKHETMRLLRGASSIWTSELTEVLKDKEYVNKNRVGVQFLGGVARIPVKEKNTLEYLRLHPANVGDRRNGAGKFDFYEYDVTAEQKRKHDAEMDRVLLISEISTMDENKMVKLALFLGIKPNEEEVGLPRTPQGFRTELMLLASKRPADVKKYIGSTEVDISYAIRKAILDARIDLTNGTAMWAGNGGFICKIPKNDRPLPYLTEFALTNTAEGRTFKEQLETIST